MPNNTSPDCIPKPKSPPSVIKAKKKAILERIRETGRVAQSCRDLGLAVNQPYEWASRDDEFAKKFDAARQQGERVLLAQYEQHLDQHVQSVEGIDQYAKVQNSLFFRMKRLDPAYRDNAQVQVITGPINVMFGMDTSQTIDITPSSAPNVGAGRLPDKQR